ncbi:MAG: hypothetical protein NTY91_00455 [Euryarchaeota archaeon]|jgi:hypothetical protein|nr:hypothetical protein [Euryarchaeota archaeon]
MRNTVRKRYFLKNEEAVSEEFTVLPALSVVMIGFALFVILLAQTYLVYADRIDRLQSYQTADGLLQKLTNPDCFFIRESGLIDVHLLQDNTYFLQQFFEKYTRAGLHFLLQLHWNNQLWEYPNPGESNPLSRTAVSKGIGVYLNEAQTIPGTLTIVLWKVS